MAVELKTMRCPSCGARLKVDPHSKFAECPACETQVNIYNEAEATARIAAGKVSGAERDAVIFPFSITEEQYRLNFVNWLDQDIFPFEVYDMIKIKSSCGYYVPFYLYRGNGLMLPVCASDKIDGLYGKYGESIVEGMWIVVNAMIKAGGYEEYKTPEDGHEILSFDYSSERCFSHKARKILSELEYSSAWEADTTTPAYFSMRITEFTIMDQEYIHISSGMDVYTFWASVPEIKKEYDEDYSGGYRHDEALRKALSHWLSNEGYDVPKPIKQEHDSSWQSAFETAQILKYNAKKDIITCFLKSYKKQSKKEGGVTVYEYEAKNSWGNSLLAWIGFIGGFGVGVRVWADSESFLLGAALFGIIFFIFAIPAASQQLNNENREIKERQGIVDECNKKLSELASSHDRAKEEALSNIESFFMRYAEWGV